MITLNLQKSLSDSKISLNRIKEIIEKEKALEELSGLKENDLIR